MTRRHAGARAAVLFAVLFLVRDAAAADRARARPLPHVPVAVMPEAAFHTLATDFFVQRDGTVYVQTGDIPAMWLRDSAAQSLPYVRLSAARPALRSWIRGVVLRDARNIGIDPYANAFKSDYKIWERKWEVDSLAWPVLLAWTYEHETGDRWIFSPQLHRAFGHVVDTFACEQRHDACSHYRFPRDIPAASRPWPVTGMIWSAFRASDDATHFPYNVAEQMIAVTALRDIADLATRGYNDAKLAKRAELLAASVDRAIARYGVVDDFRCGGRIYAYEVDGRGNWIVEDDANAPSLVGAPLVGYVSIDDPTYHRTRECMLSRRNPYYFSGRYAAGVGSAHTPKGYVWPLALEVRALTSSSRDEVIDQLRELAASAGPDGLMHESFDPNDPRQFTRARFGWANAGYAAVLFRTTAGYGPEQVGPLPEGPFRRMVADSFGVVDSLAALQNRTALLSAFERALPIRVFGKDAAT